ncbi:hypothetical protein Tco_0920050 [Tanacetum coccineum]
MDIVALEASSSLWNISLYKTRPKPCLFRLPTNKILLHCTTGGTTRFTTHSNKIILHSRKTRLATSVSVKTSSSSSQNHPTQNNVVVGGFVEVLVKKGLVLAAVCCGVFLVLGCNNKAAVAVAAEEILNGGGGNYVTAGLEQIKVSFVNSLPKILMVLKVLKEQGLILAALFGLSAFFSMAETSITTLWPWKKELHQLHLDEEALKETLEEEAMYEKERMKKIRQKQADDEEFMLKFRVKYDSEYESE